MAISVLAKSLICLIHIPAVSSFWPFHPGIEPHCILVMVIGHRLTKEAKNVINILEGSDERLQVEIATARVIPDQEQGAILLVSGYPVGQSSIWIWYYSKIILGIEKKSI